MLGNHCCVGFSLVAARGSSSLVTVHGFLIAVAWPGTLRYPGFEVATRGFSSWGSWALQHRLNSVAHGFWLFQGIWDLPRSGIDPMSPALTGRFFTEPPRKPWTWNFKKKIAIYYRKSINVYLERQFDSEVRHRRYCIFQGLNWRLVAY